MWCVASTVLCKWNLSMNVEQIVFFFSRFACITFRLRVSLVESCLLGMRERVSDRVSRFQWRSSTIRRNSFNVRTKKKIQCLRPIYIYSMARMRQRFTLRSETMIQNKTEKNKKKTKWWIKQPTTEFNGRFMRDDIGLRLED